MKTILITIIITIIIQFNIKFILTSLLFYQMTILIFIYPKNYLVFLFPIFAIFLNSNKRRYTSQYYFIITNYYYSVFIILLNRYLSFLLVFSRVLNHFSWYFLSKQCSLKEAIYQICLIFFKLFSCSILIIILTIFISIPITMPSIYRNSFFLIPVFNLILVKLINFAIYLSLFKLIIILLNFIIIMIIMKVSKSKLWYFFFG